MLTNPKQPTYARRACSSDSPIYEGQCRQACWRNRGGTSRLSLSCLPVWRPLVLETRGFIVGSAFRKPRLENETSKGDHEWEQKCGASLGRGYNPTAFLAIVVGLPLDVAVDDQRSRIRARRDAA
jgi:hypothetical protein